MDIIQDIKDSIYKFIKRVSRGRAMPMGKSPGGHGHRGRGLGRGTGGEFARTFEISPRIPARNTPPFFNPYLLPRKDVPGIGYGLYRSKPQKEIIPVENVDMAENTELAVENSEMDDKIIPGFDNAEIAALINQISENYPNVDTNLITYLINDVLTYGHVVKDDNDGKVVAVDFDGTIAEWAEYPEIGAPIQEAIEIINKLVEEGWLVYIYSTRAGYPGGKQQILEWCAKYGVNISAVYTKPFARWYIDDRAIVAHPDSWSDIYDKLHYDIPTSYVSPVITSSSILEGKHSLKTIIAALGYDYDELYKDILQLQGSLTSAQVMVLENKFKNKYNIDISLEKYANIEDKSEYWRLKFAKLLSKIENNEISEGDSVLFITPDSKFGEFGTVTSIKDDTAEVASDTSMGEIYSIRNYRKNLKLVAGLLRTALREDNGLLWLPKENRHLKMSNIREWYNHIKDNILENIRGDIKVTYRLADDVILTCNANATELNSLNFDKLISVKYENKSPTSDMAYVKIASKNPLNSTHKYVINDYMTHIVSNLDLKNVWLVYSGDNAMHCVLQLNKEQNTKDIKAKLVELTYGYIDDYNASNYISYTDNSKEIYIDASNDGAPMPYSLNEETGRVCLPVTLENLDAFDAESAKLENLMVRNA